MEESAALREKLKEAIQRVDQLEVENATLRTAEGSCTVFLCSGVGRVIIQRLANLSSLEEGLRLLFQNQTATPEELLALVTAAVSSSASSSGPEST